MWKIISKSIFWLSIVFIITSLFTLSVGQKTNLEFQDLTIRDFFYDTIFMGLPLAIILTLFGTIKMKNEILRNVMTSVFTIGLGILAFIFIMNTMFTIAFGSWVTVNILYEKKNDNQIEIREQQYDLGSFGYGKKRIAEVKPYTLLFYEVIEIDTSKINKSEWKLINKEGDLNFP